ncbi:FtsX-like permease family protein [Roseiflexus sp.]|uniref:FtsX-like permease family protein n=1 Tax=Roseiflexus sp. TaxID=2562120 RepID=UPI00398B62B8
MLVERQSASLSQYATIIHTEDEASANGAPTTGVPITPRHRMGRMRRGAAALRSHGARPNRPAFCNKAPCAHCSHFAGKAPKLLPPSQSVELARRALDLPTGGGAPLAAALLAAIEAAQQARAHCTGLAHRWPSELGTMSISVLERTREMGVLRAIGASNSAVQRMVITEGMMSGMLS